ncbi:MAG: hypothetical protein KDE09_02290 [Anaerolineales bacterium]|nr:hypothetical protein [Anaerolineales bacterium]
MKYLKWLIGLFLLAATASTTAAQTQPSSCGDWLANYWDNVNLTGDPVVVRFETAIDHAWGNGAPAELLPVNRFSARWTRTVEIPAGRYRFTLTVDDGARLWVNGQLFIDSWRVQALSTYEGEIYLPGGPTQLQLEYFENTGLATVSLDWTPIELFTERWQGEYFNNVDLSGNPALIRADGAIDFDWGSSSPAPDIIGPNSFSARWTRTVSLPGGQYQFTVTSDDGVRVWVNGTLLINQWQAQAPTTFQREIAIPAGNIPIEVHYYEDGGNAEIQLDWVRLHALPQPVPGNLVDETSVGFTYGGPAADWTVAAEGYAGALLWTRSSAAATPPYNWGRWYPDLVAGVYEVSVYIPERFSTTAGARYWISHRDGYTLRTVDQSANGGQWVSLGVYAFEGSGSDFVSLADVTYEAETRLVAYDAMRWIPVVDQ